MNFGNNGAFAQYQSSGLLFHFFFFFLPIPLSFQPMRTTDQITPIFVIQFVSISCEKGGRVRAMLLQFFPLLYARKKFSSQEVSAIVSR